MGGEIRQGLGICAQNLTTRGTRQRPDEATGKHVSLQCVSLEELSVGEGKAHNLMANVSDPFLLEETLIF